MLTHWVSSSTSIFGRGGEKNKQNLKQSEVREQTSLTWVFSFLCLLEVLGWNKDLRAWDTLAF